jgi:hypothetical protein
MATVVIRPRRADFYKRFIMGRANFSPRDFGVDLDREPFIGLMIDEFNGMFQGRQTIDELLLRPREALHFCDELRHKHRYFDLPDDIILRVVASSPGYHHLYHRHRS